MGWEPSNEVIEEYLYSVHPDTGGHVALGSHTAGCNKLKEFATPGWRISLRTYSRQYQVDDPLGTIDGGSDVVLPAARVPGGY